MAENLDPKKIENILALTPMQEGMLFHYLKAPGSGIYFEQLSIEIGGEIDRKRFEKAWNIVVQANEMLRTVFRWEKLEKPSQIILKEYQCKIKLYDFSNMDNGQMKTALEKIRNNDRDEGFDLTHVPFRVILSKLSETQYEMVISNHHILYDGWSNGIILKEFFSTYHSLSKGVQILKLPAKSSFKEYIKWLQSRDKNKQEHYWREYLADFETSTELPIKKRVERAASPGDYSIILEEDIKNKLDIFAKNNRITLASVFYTAWGILLQIYCSSEDVVFGTTVSGRSAGIKGIEDMVGLFINTIPLRVQSVPSLKIIDIISGVENVLKVRAEFECTPLPDIKNYSTLSREGGTGSLFDTIVAMENYPLDSRLLPEDSRLLINSYSAAEMTHYDLTVGIMPFNRVELKFFFNQGIFTKEAIENLAFHFINILQSLIDNPGAEISSLEIITIAEKHRLLYEFNNPTLEYPINKTIHQLFAEQVEKSPDCIAVFGHGQIPATLTAPDNNVGADPHVCPVQNVRNVSLTYRQLNEQSDRLAGLLLEKGVLADSIAGIMMKRSADLIIGIIGILKCGAAYLPIDTNSPEERIEYMLRDSSAAILLTNLEMKKMDNCQLSISGRPSRGSQHSAFAIPRIQQSNHLAYVIYTSGSTGKPKAVPIMHANICPLLHWGYKQLGIGTGDRALQNLSYYFDWSVWEIFIILTTGASLYIAPEDVLFNPEACGGFIDNNKITVLHATPTQYRFLLNLGQRFETLKYLFLGAEKLTFEMVESSFASVNNRCRVFNMYGPTEATIIAAVLEIQREYKNPGLSSVPIGIPVGNNQLFILNKYNQLCPIDVNGELYIEGGGVAMGYLNNPELTAEKFKFNRSYESNKTYIFYKTGDLTHWLPDGGIEFLGRIDQQVKIRGMRIELGEIESRLLTYPGIKEAVILSRDDEYHGNYLCAYIITNKALNILELREYLAKELPPYMIPSHFMYLDSLPLNPNGKIDREALPKPPKEWSLSEKTYVAPESNVEKIIADIWKQVLKIDKVGINDNFFDLGGNSFTIIRLSNKLKDAFKKEIPVAALFNYPTIASQSEYLSGREFVKQDAQQQTLPVEVEKMGMDIAVIGMAGRFPGARNIDQFWTNIKEGVESITFFIDEELETMGVDLELIKNPNYVKAKGVLEHIEYFDPDLFDYSTREAELMDPQFRIMHECVYEALEDAGYDPQNYNSGIGLYVGSYFNSIWMRQLYTEITSHSGLLGIESLNESNYLSTRIAYKLNLKGPAVTIQTACSTSLVAIDAACQSLLSGKCKIALAGGITITLQDQAGYLYEEGMVRSPDGHCRPFDAEAKGTIGGNGAAVVVLKPLADAIADGDHIRAVVKGSATNNDGSRKVGYTAPSVEGQAEAIRAAHAAAGISPETITYVETHGTGTALGDPIEIEALKKAFGTTKKHYCRLGTLKANIGHLDAAAGVVGFIKTVLALEHRELPPAINVRVTNPQIDFENSPFYITDKLDKWENENHPLRAGVSSFGIGGTNAHVVLEEAPKIQPPGTGKDKKLIILSAKTKNSLERACFNLAQHLIQNPGINLSDAAYTLQVGRKAFTHRRTVVGSTSSEFINALTHPAGNPAVSTATCEGSSKHIIFMFSGQGSQYENMGLGLYHTEPVFREEMNRAFEILRSLTSYDIKAILYPALANESYRANITIDQTEIAQPVLFAIEYALAKLLISWGIKPHAMIGHSIGEYTAACLAGVFSLQEALTLVVSRGKLMQEMPAGSMLSVPLPKEEVEPLLKSFHNLSLAAVNSSSLCVISGPNDAVDAFTALLKERGQPSTRLHTSHAFHSHMMEPMLASFREKVKDITLKPPISPYISNTTGYWITVEQAINPQYWVNHVRETVYFNEGLTELLKDANAVLVEIGPGNVLSTFARKHKDRSDQQPVISLLRHPGDKISDDYFLLQQIGQLWLSGATVRWEEFYRDEQRCRVPLPTYSFDHRYFWKYGREIQYKSIAVRAEDTPKTGPRQTGDEKPYTRKPIDEWFYIPCWQAAPRTKVPPRDGVSGKWLVFSNETGFEKSLSIRLKKEGAEIAVVKAGSSFARLADDVYTLNPAKPDDYINLLKALTIENKIPRNIVHLWNTQQEDGQHPDRVLEKGFYSLIYLAQAVGKQGLTNEMTVIVISSNMQAVLDNEPGNPLQSTLLGACKVIPKEYPNILVRSIDITHTEPGSREEQKLLDLLMKEWAGEDNEQEKTVDIEVAYRHNVRWVQMFNPIVLSAPQNLAGRLREKGVYLITGGMGGMGMQLAGYLAKSARARIILTDLLPFPGHDLWDAWAAEHGQEDPITQKIRQLKELEAQGAEITVAQADAADYNRMKIVINDIIHRFGSLDGVIHTAGLPDGGIIQAKTREAMEAVMAPKIKGTLILDALLSELCGNRPPGFLVLCSSLTAILGSFGQVAYTAANIFLNSFARYKNKTTNPVSPMLTVSINWDAWEEVGMSARAENEFQRVEVKHPLFQDRVQKEDGKIIYNSRFSIKNMWVLDEHRIMGKAILPGTAYLEMARAIFELHTGSAQVIIKEIFFLEPLSMDENEEREVQTVLEKQGDNFAFTISNRRIGGTKWHLNASGKLEHLVQPDSMTVANEPDINAWQAAAESPVPDLNPGLMTFGPRFANIRTVKYGINRGLAVLELNRAFLDDLTSYKLHPALMDRALSILDAKVKSSAEDNYMPFSYQGIKIIRPLPGKITSLIRYIENPSAQKDTLEFKVHILDEKANTCVEIESFVMKRVSTKAPANWVGKMKNGEIDENRDVRLEIAEPGNLDSLSFIDTPRIKPGPGEVEIQVYATGLNFKEVLFALGMLPLPPGRRLTFGLECSGRITSCGEGVDEFKAGDDVIAFASSAFSRFVVVPTTSIARKPSHLGFEESAAIPVAFMTAYYSLITLGRLKKGERVLIHSAAGGVGLAAVRIAQWVGAEIFATAGNPGKREYLASLGIQHVMDSRSTKFADEVMAITGKKGVDVILNSLSGESILKGISILTTYGRFLELGVRDIAENTALGMRAFEKSTSFTAVSMGVDAPGFTGIFREMVSHINDKHFDPLPIHVYPIEQSAEAFKYMAQAKHIGKIVISHPKPRELIERGILPGEGIDVFSRVLNLELPAAGPGLSHIMVSTWDFNSRLRENWKKRTPGSDKSDQTGAAKCPSQTGSRSPRPSLTTDYAPPLSEMEKRLAAVWEEYLGLEKVGIHDNFFELGASSLDIIQVNHKLNALIEKELSVVTFYTYPTVHTLAAHLGGEKPAEDTFLLSKSQKTLKGTINKMKEKKK